MKSLRLFSLVFLLSFSLNACSESTLAATPSLTPDVIPTFTPNPTATFTPTFTPTPEATATPEAPKMTLEDWKGVFNGKFTGSDGNEYNFSKSQIAVIER